MEFEQFRDFMLQSAAKHDAQISTLQEMVKSLVSVTEKLVENQIHLEKTMNESFRRMALERIASEEENREARREIRAELAELSRIVFRHVTDREAHSRS